MFWVTLGSTVLQVPKGELFIVMIYTNARTGAGGEGCVDDKVRGACGRDMLNANRLRMLGFSA